MKVHVTERKDQSSVATGQEMKSKETSAIKILRQIAKHNRKVAVQMEKNWESIFVNQKSHTFLHGPGFDEDEVWLPD